MAPQADRPPQLHRIDDRDIRLLLLASIAFGGLAQLARAPALQAGGQRFESVILHQGKELRLCSERTLTCWKLSDEKSSQHEQIKESRQFRTSAMLTNN